MRIRVWNRPTSQATARAGRMRLMFSLMLAILLAVPTMAIQAAEPAASTVSGTVRDTNGAAIGDARVVTRLNNAPIGDDTDAGGAYSLLLPDGTYEFGVRPAGAASTVSPTWVYTGALVLATVPPPATIDFTVEPATVTVVGDLNMPSTVTGDFDDPGNRAWVRAENQEGQGNTVQVDTDGGFTIKTIPGLILIRVTLENPSLSAPAVLRSLAYLGDASQTVNVDGDPTDADQDPITLVQKTSSISGSVKLFPGASTLSVANIPVRAWRVDGSEIETDLTDASGNFSIPLIAGTWFVRAAPLADISYGGDYYIPAASPIVVRVGESQAVTGQNVSVALADVTVSGCAADGSSSSVPVPCYSGADLNQVDGRVYATYIVNGVPQVGPSVPLVDGVFTNLRLSSAIATQYKLGIFFPNDLPFTAAARADITVAASENKTGVKIPIVKDNALIFGELRDRSGNTLPGVPARIWAASDSGGWARTAVNTVTGEYVLPVATVDTAGSGGSFWRVRAYTDPIGSDYYIQRPRAQTAFLPFNPGTTPQAEVNFTAVRVSTMGRIRGVVTAPNGTTPLNGIRVNIREITDDGAAGIFRSVITRPTLFNPAGGAFEVRVPPGSYSISVSVSELLRRNPGIPAPLKDNLVEPARQIVTITQDRQLVQVALQYREADATVTGTVFYDSATPVPVIVRAVSSDGAVVYVRAQADNDITSPDFTIKLKSGLSWTLTARGSDQDVFLRSNRVSFTPAAGAQALPQQLTLEAAEDLPESAFYVFDADEPQSFVMSDGSAVDVPAGAMGENINVVLTVRPLPDLASDGGAQPVSFGYRLHAFVADSATATARPLQPITSFRQPVTLVIPFTQAQLDALGITADRLQPSYWDEASESWQPVETVSVHLNPDGSGDGEVWVQVTHFTDYALLAALGQNIYLPATQR